MFATQSFSTIHITRWASNWARHHMRVLVCWILIIAAIPFYMYSPADRSFHQTLVLYIVLSNFQGKTNHEMEYLHLCRHYNNILPGDHGYSLRFDDPKTWDHVFRSPSDGLHHQDFSSTKCHICHELFQHPQWFIHHHTTDLGRHETQSSPTTKNWSYNCFHDSFVVSL